MWQGENYDNIYEGDVQFSKQQVYLPEKRGVGTQSNQGSAGVIRKNNGSTSTQQRAQNTGTHRSSKFFPIIVGMLILIAISVIGSLGMTSAILTQMPMTHEKNDIVTPPHNNDSASLASEQMPLQHHTPTPNKSCLDFRQKGIRKNGVYKVATKVEDFNIDVFCDMETDGGGWTLVASVHEDDIKEKCGAKDRWATHVSPGFVGTVVKTTWENKLTFGKPEDCMKDDYKNRAYYELNARDVMIWHVPSESTIANMRDRSNLRYRTSNHFLASEGRNLHGLFNERYPLNKIKRRDLSVEKRRTRRVLDAIYDRRHSLRSKISSWDKYSFTGGTREYYIRDSSLYSSSSGNQVIFSFRYQSHGYLNYEREYEFTRQRFIVNTKRSQPFIMATAIANADGSASDLFGPRVHSYLRSASYQNELLENNVTFHNFQLQYRAVQYYLAAYPSICEFHFIVFNEKEWGSLPPKRFSRTYQYSSPGTYYYSDFTVEGNTQNFVMGYLLLTRAAGYKVTKTQTDAVADVVLNAIVPLIDLFNEQLPPDGLSVPVTYDKGSSSTVLNMVPPVYRPYVEPGYLQLRAYNLTGYPNALCPGMRMKSINPEYMCIGGVSEDVRKNYGTCGDFAGWAGKDGDIIQPSSSAGHAHSRSDLSSTILIFYR